MHHLSLAVVAALVVGFAALSRTLTRSTITPAMFFVAGGFVAGGEVLGWIDLPLHTSTVRALAEATLALVLFADASRIDRRRLRREYAVPLRLLAIGLPLTILLGWVAGGLLGDLGVAEALVLAIVLAPTDAALGQAVVIDRRLPSRIRQGLNVESGLNDGICVPLLLIALAVAEASDGPMTAHHAATLVWQQIGYGVLLGALAGAAGAAAVRLGSRHRTIEPGWLQILPVGIAGLAYGLAVPAGGSGFIAAFVAGGVFGRLRRDAGGEVTHLVDELGELANAITFIAFGSVAIGPLVHNLTWRMALYAVLSLTVVRMLPVAIALVGTGARRQTVAYLGWFGPRGLASIVFTVLVIEESTLPHAATIELVAIATIVLSVVAHGLTARPLTDRYVRWFDSHPRDRRPPMESVPAEEHPWRRVGGPAPGQAAPDRP